MPINYHYHGHAMDTPVVGCGRSGRHGRAMDAPVMAKTCQNVRKHGSMRVRATKQYGATQHRSISNSRLGIESKVRTTRHKSSYFFRRRWC